VSGISLHAGVSRGVAGRLHSPAVDARDLAAAAAARGFGVQRVLIDSDADVFLAELRVVVSRVRRGDTLLITFSGHGRANAWCFADRDLQVGEVGDVLALRPRGVRVVIVADACHSDAWRAIDGVTLIAPPDQHPRDGAGLNTRTPFVAQLLRDLRVNPALLTPAAATPARRGARSCDGKAARRRR